jgi:L-threonylcarbamoyladenylate synthase
MTDQPTNIFAPNTITAFPTNTSFGLGVRADDETTIQKMYALKQRPSGKFFSLMVKDWEMLQKFAEVPKNFPLDYFTESPRTVILKPTKKLPKSKYWPAEKVAFRISTIPAVRDTITYPITATSANLSGEVAIYNTATLKQKFGSQIVIFPGFEQLPVVQTSEIWDYTTETPVRIR